MTNYLPTSLFNNTINMSSTEISFIKLLPPYVIGENQLSQNLPTEAENSQSYKVYEFKAVH